MARGWVYVMTNSAMPGLIKIGYSMKDPKLRAGELANTGVPVPYEVAYEALVDNPREIEQKTHRALAHANEGKEWFRCEVAMAVQQIKLSAGTEILLESLAVDYQQEHVEFTRIEKLRLRNESFVGLARQTATSSLPGMPKSAVKDRLLEALNQPSPDGGNAVACVQYAISVARYSVPKPSRTISDQILGHIQTLPTEVAETLRYMRDTTLLIKAKALLAENDPDLAEEICNELREVSTLDRNNVVIRAEARKIIGDVYEFRSKQETDKRNKTELMNRANQEYRDALSESGGYAFDNFNPFWIRMLIDKATSWDREIPFLWKASRTIVPTDEPKTIDEMVMKGKVLAVLGHALCSDKKHSEAEQALAESLLCLRPYSPRQSSLMAAIFRDYALSMEKQGKICKPHNRAIRLLFSLLYLITEKPRQLEDILKKAVRYDKNKKLRQLDLVRHYINQKYWKDAEKHILMICPPGEAFNKNLAGRPALQLAGYTMTLYKNTGRESLCREVLMAAQNVSGYGVDPLDRTFPEYADAVSAAAMFPAKGSTKDRDQIRREFAEAVKGYALPLPHRCEAEMLNEVSAFDASFGYVALALERADRAMSIWKEIYGEECVGFANSLCVIAIAESRMDISGDDDEDDDDPIRGGIYKVKNFDCGSSAESNARRAIEIVSTVQGDNSEEMIFPKYAMACAKVRKGELDAAKDYLHSAIDLRRALPGPLRPSIYLLLAKMIELCMMLNLNEEKIIWKGELDSLLSQSA